MIKILFIISLFIIPNTVFAAGGFVSSPSANQAPTVVKGENSNKNCNGTVVVTSYANRATLDTAARTVFEQATASIKGSADLTKLNNSLSKIASDNKINSANLAVSDIFNISVSNHAGHENHGNFVCNIHPGRFRLYLSGTV